MSVKQTGFESCERAFENRMPEDFEDMDQAYDDYLSRQEDRFEGE